jgi:hypothetical protein
MRDKKLWWVLTWSYYNFNINIEGYSEWSMIRLQHFERGKLKKCILKASVEGHSPETGKNARRIGILFKSNFCRNHNGIWCYVKSYRECKCSSYVLKSAREYSLVWCKYQIYFNSIIYNLLYFIHCLFLCCF